VGSLSRPIGLRENCIFSYPTKGELPEILIVGKKVTVLQILGEQIEVLV
jgi:hypothetical protein